MIDAVKKNPKHFVIVNYTRTNESFPVRLPVMVNGEEGILEEGRPLLLPRFLVAQALQSRNFTHRDRPEGAGGNEEQETIRVRPNIDIEEIADEYQSPEGIMRLLDESKKITDRESPYYRLRLGCKNLVFGDMTPAKLGAGLDMTGKKPQLSVEEEARLEVEAEIRAEQKQSLKEKMRAEMLAADSKTAAEVVKDPESKKFEFNGQEYKSESAMKAAITRFDKAEAAKPTQTIEDADPSEEIAIEVDV